MTETADSFVVVGAGQAGAWVARTLRAEGFAGRLVLIGREAHQPYERPPLSKAVLAGAATPESAVLLTAAQAEGLAIECWLSTEVAALDRAGQRVICADGRVLHYDRLFLTTGGRARTLPGWEAATHPRIHLLRTLDDAARLRAALTGGAAGPACAGRTLLVLGGGWIGLEVAATAAATGRGGDGGGGGAPAVRAGIATGRVRLSAGSAYGAWRDDSPGLRRRVGGRHGLGRRHGAGGRHRAGGRPCRDRHRHATRYRAGRGGRSGGGGRHRGGRDRRTSDPLIYAAGDAASHPSAFAGTSLRLESWANAQNQAIVAAKAALGHDVRYAEVPWFWSDQYDVNLQILGLPERGVRAVARGAPQAGSGAWLMLGADGRVAGVIAVNAPRDLRGVRKMIGDGLTPDPAAWADTATPLNRIGSLPPAA